MRSSYLIAAAVLAMIGEARAASLSVTPVNLTRIAPAAAATLSLTDTGVKPINVQVRVFAWRQADGIETLAPATDVIASPPMARLEPGARYTIRIVRIARKAVVGEEGYRVFVDELPQAPSRPGNSVNLVLRYSIPAFFTAAGASPPSVEWRLRYQSGRFFVSAVNRGATRMQVAGLSIRDAGGATFELNRGLVGYVLGGSRMQWTIAAGSPRRPQSGPAILSYRSDGNVAEVPVDLRIGG